MCLAINIKNRRENYSNFKKMHKKLDDNYITYKFTIVEVNDNYVNILYYFPHESHIMDIYDYMYK